MTDDTQGDARALASALDRLGFPVEVESRARLAVLVASDATARRLAVPDARRDVIAAARAHGFTHVAVELSQSAFESGAPVLRD